MFSCSLLPAPCSLLPAPCSLKTQNMETTNQPLDQWRETLS
ncbi:MULTISPECIES: hypothetical protein [unclassified Moorena]|nr:MULTISPECIES: hypothetical protein [unclassified Moorena]